MGETGSMILHEKDLLWIQFRVKFYPWDCSRYYITPKPYTARLSGREFTTKVLRSSHR